MAGESYVRGLQTSALKEQMRMKDNPFADLFNTVVQLGSSVLGERIRGGMEEERQRAKVERIKSEEEGIQVPIPGAKPQIVGPYAKPEEAFQRPTESLYQAKKKLPIYEEARKMAESEREATERSAQARREDEKIKIMRERADAYLTSLRKKPAGGKKDLTPYQKLNISTTLKSTWDDLNRAENWSLDEAVQHIKSKKLDPTNPYFKDVLSRFPNEKSGVIFKGYRTKPSLPSEAPGTVYDAEQEEEAVPMTPGFNTQMEDDWKRDVGF